MQLPRCLVQVPSPGKGAALVQDLSALTPPLLMCAAVLFAVGAFLRHEMGKKRSAEDDQESAGPGAPPASGRQPDNSVAGAGPPADAADER